MMHLQLRFAWTTILSILLYQEIYCAKILGIVPIPSKSHAILMSELLKGLLPNGHHVTMMSAHPLNNPPENFTNVALHLDKLQKVYENNIMNATVLNFEVFRVYETLRRTTDTICDDVEFQRFIKTPQKFDVIIYTQFGIDFLLGLSHIFNASTIAFSVCGVNQFTTPLLNYKMPSSYVPSLFSYNGDQMNFWQRLGNFMIANSFELYLWYYNTAQQARMLKEVFPTAPALDELKAGVKLLLANTHMAVDSIRPMLQNMIEIGGYYFKNTEEMKDDLHAFLNKSQNGVIYISLGSNLASKNLHQDFINEILDYCKISPYDILWKFDFDLPVKPPNVKIMPWVPQRAVLDHPNVKLFITHGGKGSINEAIYYGVPILGIPFYLDQFSNSEFVSQKEIGLKLSKDNLKNLDSAVNQIMNNSKYRNNIQFRSKLFRYQDIDPMKKAIYWIEYVINNQDSNVCMSPTLNLSWYQLESLDVIAFLILVVCLVVYGFYFILNAIYWRLMLLFRGKEKTN